MKTKTNIIRKMTEGWVDQRFDPNTGELISQEFHAGNGTCEYEDDGETVDQVIADKLYATFDMVQPVDVTNLAHAIAEALEKAAPKGVVVGEEERAVISRAIQDFQTQSDCGECMGYGWLESFSTSDERLEIQRCGACGRFETDNEALEHVSLARKMKRWSM